MKPKTADVFFVYQCEKCGQQHQASIKETKFPGGVLCFCGSQIRFDPIKHVHLNIEYVRTKNKGLDKPAKSLYNGPRAYRTQVINSLVKLGYTRGQVRNAYSSILQDLPDPSNDEDVIKRLLKVL